jgi:hypothetical protein
VSTNQKRLEQILRSRAFGCSQRRKLLLAKGLCLSCLPSLINTCKPAEFIHAKQIVGRDEKIGRQPFDPTTARLVYLYGAQPPVTTHVPVCGLCAYSLHVYAHTIRGFYQVRSPQQPVGSSSLFRSTRTPDPARRGTPDVRDDLRRPPIPILAPSPTRCLAAASLAPRPARRHWP